MADIGQGGADGAASRESNDHPQCPPSRQRVPNNTGITKRKTDRTPIRACAHMGLSNC